MKIEMPNKRKKSRGKSNKIATFEPEGANVVIGNPGFSCINQIILSFLDHESQMSFRQVCQSWKAQVDQPQFWIKKLDLKGKDLFDQSHNPSHSTLYPDVLKIKTIIVVKQIFAKMPFVY